MAMALISLTWETQKQRGVQLFLQWAIMQGVAMLLQNRYQRQRLCTHIALGKARRMDIVWGETAGVDGQLWLLAPILFILQRVYTMGDVYPNSTKLSKGEYNLQLYLRHDNVQYLEKMKQLVLFIERNLEDKEIIRLSFYSQPNGLVMGNGSFKSSVLVPGVKEAFYVGPPTKDKLPKNSPEGSVLLGAISYGKLSFGVQEKGKNPQKNPVSYQIYYRVPPIKFDEDKGKGCSTACTKSVSERLEEEVRDAKIKVLASLKQGTAEECLEWKKLSSSLKSEYPKYTPLLAKILEGLLSQNKVEDKIPHLEEVMLCPMLHGFGYRCQVQICEQFDWIFHA